MLEVFFLRHGQTSWNAQNNRYCGRTDIALTDKGLAQAEDVSRQLEDIKFDKVYASPLERAYRTAEIASSASRQEPVLKDQRLIEVDFGAWEGKRRDEFVAEDPLSWENWSVDPALHKAGRTGESGLEVVTRVDEFFKEVNRNHSNGRIMVVAHNGVNRLYLAWKLGMPLKNYRQLVQDNSTVTVFELDQAGVLTLKYLNVRYV